MSHPNNSPPPSLPLVVTLNCIEDALLEQECLSGVAHVQHAPLTRLSHSQIDSAAAVILHSLAFLPRAAQRRLRPSQLILCLGSADRDADSALASELALDSLIHVDVSRAEEVADTVMALILGLLRRTHLLSRHALSAAGWLGSVQPLCRGMRRCRGLVLGVVGRSASAAALACRSLAFNMNVLYFDLQQESRTLNRSKFPKAARKMDTLNDLLAASDLISLHCALTAETIQIINADCLSHIKPGAFLVNTGSSQLLDDCAVKQCLIDGTLAGCALDGTEGPQWMEAWVREMPNVLILPRSADYSEEVWMEIREKAISILHQFFTDKTIPKNTVSDDDEEESEAGCINEQSLPPDNEISFRGSVSDRVSEDTGETSETKDLIQSKDKEHSVISQDTPSRSETKRRRSRKKSKKGNGGKKSQHKVDHALTSEKANTFIIREDDASMSGQVLSSGSRSVSPEDLRNRKTPVESKGGAACPAPSNIKLQKPDEGLKDGFIIALHARDRPGLHVSRQRVQGGGWFLDTLSNVTKRDPASQFLVISKSEGTFGLRSFTAGGKLLQINRRMEFVFASHSFDAWESWTLQGSFQDCRLVNCRNPLAVLDVCIEIIAAVGEDGVTRWLD